jgi:hypothetical protein
MLLLIHFLTLGSIIPSVLNYDQKHREFFSNPNAIWEVNLIDGIVSTVVVGNNTAL